MKRILGVFLTIILSSFLLLTGCVSGNQTTSATADTTTNINAVGTYPIAKNKITISAMMQQTPDLQDYNTNAFTKHLEDLTNINIKWDAIPQADFQTKKQLELSSGKYPDIFLHGDFSHPEIIKYGQQQHILTPLDDLINKYAPNIKKAMEELPDLKAGMVAPDGHIYAIPTYNACFHCWYSQKYWINTKWLQDLGMKAPTTTAEFEQVLKAFKEKYPNSIPLSGEGPGNQDSWHTDLTAFLMNSFIYDNGTDYLFMNNGKVDIAANKKQWQEGLKYISKLYNEGLIDPGAFTQNVQTLQQKGHKTPEQLGTFPAGVSWIVEPNGASKQWLDYSTLAPLKGPEGVQYSGYFKAVGTGVGMGEFAISNKASKEEQVAAIRLADYLYTLDGTEGVELGTLGKMWYKAKPGEKGLDGQDAIFSINPEWWSMPTQNEHWDQQTINFRPRWIFDAKAASTDPNQPSYSELLLHQESKNKYQPYTPPTSMIYPNDYVWADPQSANDEAQLQTSINNYINTWIGQFVTGHKDIDKDWDTYVSGFKGLNLDKYLSILQSDYDAFAKKYPDGSKFLDPGTPNPPAGWSANDLFWGDSKK